MITLAAVVGGCALGSGASVEVDEIDDGWATVVPLSGGAAKVVDVRTLPVGVKEGDVITRGQLDEARKQALLDQIHALRDRISVTVEGGLDLDADPPSLTPGPKP